MIPPSEVELGAVTTTVVAVVGGGLPRIVVGNTPTGTEAVDEVVVGPIFVAPVHMQPY
jgi:hypothetical protein